MPTAVLKDHLFDLYIGTVRIPAKAMENHSILCASSHWLISESKLNDEEAVPIKELLCPLLWILHMPAQASLHEEKIASSLVCFDCQTFRGVLVFHPKPATYPPTIPPQFGVGREYRLGWLGVARSCAVGLSPRA